MKKSALSRLREPQLRRYQPFGNGGPALDGRLQSYQKKSPRKKPGPNVSRQKCLGLRPIIYEIVQQHVPLQPRPIKYQSTMTIKNSVNRQEFLENTARQTINIADLSRALLASASPSPKSNIQYPPYFARCLTLAHKFVRS